jgi:hypothetical protein
MQTTPNSNKWQMHPSLNEVVLLSSTAPGGHSPYWTGLMTSSTNSVQPGPVHRKLVVDEIALQHVSCAT